MIKYAVFLDIMTVFLLFMEHIAFIYQGTGRYGIYRAIFGEQPLGKNMKKKVWTVLLMCWLLLVISGAAMAQDKRYSVTLGHGESKDGIDIWRVGLKRSFARPLYTWENGFLSGYVEGSLNRWIHDKNSVTAIGASPVVACYFGQPGSRILPYVELGIGAAFLSETRIGNRDMASAFQFEDRIGAGIRYDRFDINFRYMHYSNAGLKYPNDGIDIFLLTAGFGF